MAWEVGCLNVGVSPPVPPQPSLHPLYPTLSACNVTIHNRCKDTLANCTKVKQKVRWQGGQRAFGEGSAIAAGLSTHSLPYAPLLAMRHSRPLAYASIAPQREFTHPDALNCRVSFLSKRAAARSWFVLGLWVMAFSLSCSVSQQQKAALLRNNTALQSVSLRSKSE